MKLRNKRRAFTIVELVIVVAVIGVLAAVLIPTFVNLTQKANKESDNSLVYHLNTALKMTENDPDAKDKEGNPISGKNYTMHDAVLDLEYQGYYLENLSTRSGYKLLWDMNNNKFLLEDDAALKKANVKKEDYWKVVNSVSEMGDYSGYANKGFQDVTVKVSAGFDTGNVSTITKVTYDRHDATSSKTVTIRTNDLTTELEINAPLDHVNRYGKSSVVEPLITADSSFEDHGYSPWISLTDGRLVVTSDMKIGKLFLNLDKDNENQALSITYERGATKLTQDQIKKPVLNLGEDEKVKVVEVTDEESGNTEEIWLQGSSTIEESNVLVSVNGGELEPVDSSSASDTAKAVANAYNEVTGEVTETGLTEEEAAEQATEEVCEAQTAEVEEQTGEDFSDYVARIGSTGYTDFSKAFDAVKDGETLTLLKDVNVTSPLLVTKNMTLYGSGRTITSNKDRGIRVAESNVNVEIRNLKLRGGSNFERAIQVDSNKTNVNLVINKVDALATYYAINFCGSTTVDVKIYDSIITGWATLNIWSNGVSIVAKDSSFIGINDKSKGASNNFSSICLEADTTGQIPLHSSDMVVELTNCYLSAESVYGNKQSIVGFNNNGSNGSINNIVRIKDCTIELKDQYANLYYDYGIENQLFVDDTFINNEETNLTTYSSGRYATQEEAAVDLMKYAEQGYTIDGFYYNSTYYYFRCHIER